MSTKPTAATALLETLDGVLAPLDAKIDFSLHVRTVEQMSVDLAYLRELLGIARAEIRKVLDAPKRMETRMTSSAQPYDDSNDRQRADRIDGICDALIEEQVPPEVCQQVRAYAASLRIRARWAEDDG